MGSMIMECLFQAYVIDLLQISDMLLHGKYIIAGAGPLLCANAPVADGCINIISIINADI